MLMLICFTYSRCTTVNVQVTCCESILGLLTCTHQFLTPAGDLPLAVSRITCTRALDVFSQSRFLQHLPLMLTGHCFLFQWVVSGCLLRLRTRDDDLLPPDVSAPPTFCLSDFSRTPFCCRCLLRIWLILVYLNLALICLPLIFTGMPSLSSVTLRIRVPQLGSHFLQPNPAHQSVGMSFSQGI